MCVAYQTVSPASFHPSMPSTPLLHFLAPARKIRKLGFVLTGPRRNWQNIFIESSSASDRLRKQAGPLLPKTDCCVGLPRQRGNTRNKSGDVRSNTDRQRKDPFSQIRGIQPNTSPKPKKYWLPGTRMLPEYLPRLLFLAQHNPLSP